jgi:Ser/Thr protein kinase RdoA (MazF antagonist)
MNNQYNLEFENLCNKLKLGEIIVKPEPISGGHLHRMYKIETNKGKYAIKALNPQIMMRPTAVNNYIRAECIANIAVSRVRAQPAKSIGGKLLQNIDNQFYLVFDWIDGYILTSNEITNVHCEKIGSILADIHMTDFSQLENTNALNDSKKEETDWNFYLDKGLENNSVWVNLLQENTEKLFTWSTKAKIATRMLTSEKVISHRDLEPKNVMWYKDNPIIIDWESAGYINPMHDLIETAIYWAVDVLGSIDKERFLTFISGYQKRTGVLQADWRMVLERGYLSKLDWLEYSLKRSLWIECSDEKEQYMGTLQVTETINSIRQFEDMISELEASLNMIYK